MISPKVMVELHQAKLVPTQFTVTKPGEHAWSSAEQRRFWEAIHRFPQGPWTAIAAYVGSKSTRQAMTHAQKLRQKLNRWKRRVRNDSVSSGASSPRSDMNECDDECDDEDALSPLDEESGGDEHVDMKHEHAEQQLTYQHSHQQHHHQTMMTTNSKAFFGSSSQSPDDVSCDNDEYLDHLLSDIEPVLENVVNFSSPPRSSEYDASASARYFGGEFAVAHVYPGESKHQQSLAVGDHHHASMFAQQYASHFALAPHSSPMQQQQASVNEHMAPADFRL
jgi:hypothetical protein